MPAPADIFDEVLGGASPVDPFDEVLGGKPATEPSLGEAIARGAGDFVNVSAETAGASRALGIGPKEIRESILRNNVAAPVVLGAKALKNVYDKGLSKTVDDYRAGRAETDKANNAAEAAHPIGYLGGQVGASVLAGAAAAPAKIAGMLGIGAAESVVAGAGGSKGDLTKGEWKKVGKDTLTDGGTNFALGLAGAGVGALRRLPGSLRAAAKEEAMAEDLTKYLRKIGMRDGDPDELLKTAGAAIEQAKKAHGDVLIDAKAFLTNAKKHLDEASAPGTGGLSAADKMLKRAVKEIEAADGKITLSALQNNMSKWGQRTRDWSKKKDKQRIAKLALESFKDDLAEGADSLAAAPGGTAGEAAAALRSARSDYGKAARSREWLDLIVRSEDSLSDTQAVDPKKLAGLLSGKNRKSAEALFHDDPERLAALRLGGNVARAIAKRGSGWLPESMSSPKAKEAIDRLMVYNKVTQIFSSPELAKDFVNIAFPSRTMKPEALLAAIGRLSARVGTDEGRTGRLKVAAEDLTQDTDLGMLARAKP